MSHGYSIIIYLNWIEYSIMLFYSLLLGKTLKLLNNSKDKNSRKAFSEIDIGETLKSLPVHCFACSNFQMLRIININKTNDNFDT